MAAHETMGKKINIEVITSFNQDYYDRIGQDAMRSYLANWSTDLTVYAEDCKIPNHPRVTVIDFADLGDEYRHFQLDNTLSNRCKIFAKKAFSVIHAMHHSRAEWIIWLDADVVTKRRDPAQILCNMLDSDYLAMYMGVQYDRHRDLKHGNWLVPETGLFGVNLCHPATERFRKEYRRRYLEKDFADLRRSYDNDVFGAVVSCTPARYFDLCATLHKPYKTPLKHTVFGDYLHHYKAKHSKQHYVDNQ